MNLRHPLTPSQVAESGRALSAPFGLALESANLGELEVDTILRLLPGKRLTALARWHGKKVVIKLFVDSQRWLHHWQEEMGGHEALVAAHIPTPRLLNSEQHDDGQWGIAVYEYVTPSESGERHWQRLSTDDSEEGQVARDGFLRQLAGVTARLHTAQLVQWDNHLDNFLIRRGKLLVIDSGGVKRQTRLSPAQATANLALLAAQFPCLDTRQMDLLRNAYATARGDGFPAPGENALRRETQHQRRVRLQDYIEKCQRDCTEVMVSHPRTGMFMAARRATVGPELLAWSQTPSEGMEGAESIKDGNSQTVVGMTVDGRDVVVKRYNIKDVGHWLRRIGRTSRARNAWVSAHALHLLRLPTPQPVAMIEQAIGPLHGPAWFIAEKCPGLTLDAAITANPDLVLSLRTQLATLCEVLVCHRISHGDFKASNFIVNDGHLWLIDLDAVQIHGSEIRFAKAFRKDLERFMRNWNGQPGIYNAFYEALSPLFTHLDTLSRTQA